MINLQLLCSIKIKLTSKREDKKILRDSATRVNICSSPPLLVHNLSLTQSVRADLTLQFILPLTSSTKIYTDCLSTYFYPNIFLLVATPHPTKL